MNEYQNDDEKVDWLSKLHTSDPSEIRFNHLSGNEARYVLLRWHKKIDDQISPSEIVATVETDTHTLDIEVYSHGILSEILFHEGTSIPDGVIIARLALSNENGA